MTAHLPEWVADGTALFERTVASIGDEDLLAMSALPVWRRIEVAVHVARNADALVNLLTWARTGVPTPMYGSPEQRSADIEAGARRPVAEAREDLVAANARFARAVATMPASAWDAPVRTARGRTVPAADVLWMRAREVWVHAVDLAAGVGFADLPRPVLIALIDDAAAAFAGRDDVPRVALAASESAQHWEIGSPDGRQVAVTGGAADLAAYLIGRPVAGRLTTTVDRLPQLPAWL